MLLVAAVLVNGCAAHRQLTVYDNERVQLHLKAPGARSVQIAASYNAFALQSAQRDSQGNWVVSVPGQQEFHYFFLVDGNVHLPACELTEQDDFGRSNCIFSPQP
jgi:hypothetical protein